VDEKQQTISLNDAHRRCRKAYEMGRAEADRSSLAYVSPGSVLTRVQRLYPITERRVRTLNEGAVTFTTEDAGKVVVLTVVNTYRFQAEILPVIRGLFDAPSGTAMSWNGFSAEKTYGGVAIKAVGARESGLTLNRSQLEKMEQLAKQPFETVSV
jgi:hypothetical protein